MRKTLIIGGSAVGIVVVIVIALLAYAYFNLNSIIAGNRQLILDRASAALGRTVEVQEIKATLGWGVSADLTNVKISEDPQFGQEPFLQAGDVYARLAFVPLLSGKIHVQRIELNQPEIRIIRDADGKLNASTFGTAHAAKAPQESEGEAKARSTGGTLESLRIRDVAINGGRVTYIDGNAAPVTLSDIDFQVANFTMGSPFDLSLKLAALGDKQNVDLSGRVGPLMSKEGKLDINQLPIDLKLNLGPIALADLRKVQMIAKSTPKQLSVSEPVELSAQVKGPIGQLALSADGDLTANEIVFGNSFNKPAGTALKFTANGERRGSQVSLNSARVTLGDLEIKAANIAFGGGTFSGRVDSNRFDLASVAKLAPSAARLDVTGKAEIHSDLRYAKGQPSAHGKLTLAGVSIPRPGTSTALITGLGGDLMLTGQSADVGPLSFQLGSSHATLKAHAITLYPVELTFDFSADALKPGDFAANRPSDEQLNKVNSTGKVALREGGPAVSAELTSPSGSLNSVVYQNLDLIAQVAGKDAHVRSLKFGAFGGQITATADTQLASQAPFKTTLNFTNVDVQQALQSQKSKAAGTVRGILTGQAEVAGTTGSFDQMKPTLDGAGKLAVANGKLVGVNVVADAMKKTQNLPGIGDIVPSAVVANHPELFQNPDTDIDQMSLTFVLKGPRITSHDITIKSQDYSMLGDGWFDLDKNIDLAARILLSQQLSKELIQQRQNVVYITNQQRQVEIPLQVTGQLPKPRVLPDVTQLAQRAANQAVQQRGQQAVQKFLGGNKGVGKYLGGFLGGGDNAGNSGGGNSPNKPSGQSSPTNQPPNPLDKLKGLF